MPPRFTNSNRICFRKSNGQYHLDRVSYYRFSSSQSRSIQTRSHFVQAEMNVIVICACVPTLFPLVQQVTGQEDYSSTRRAGSDEQKNKNTERSKRRLWDSKLMRPMKSQGTVETVAFHNEKQEVSLPGGEIRTTTELQTHWEAVYLFYSWTSAEHSHRASYKRKVPSKRRERAGIQDCTLGT